MNRAAITALVLLFAACAKPEPKGETARPQLSTSRDPTALAKWDAILGELRGTRAGNEELLRSLLPKNEPALLVFWATYCPPCIEEMPHLELIFRQKRAIVGVSLDAADPEKAESVRTRMRASYPNLVLDEASTKSAGAALPFGLPFAVAVGADGRAVELLSGGLEGAEVEAVFARTLSPRR